MSDEYCVGDIVRIQLAPSGERFRYHFSALGLLTDYGDGGPWTDGEIREPINISLIVKYTTQYGFRYFCFPLEGHSLWRPELPSLPGWPKPPSIRETHIPKCDCGCEAAGMGNLHSSWCSKQTYLNQKICL